MNMAAALSSERSQQICHSIRHNRKEDYHIDVHSLVDVHFIDCTNVQRPAYFHLDISLNTDIMIALYSVL
jgi:hypothetical protein